MGVKFNCGSFGSKMSQIDFQKGVQKLGLWSRIRQKKSLKMGFQACFCQLNFWSIQDSQSKGGSKLILRLFYIIHDRRIFEGSCVGGILDQSKSSQVFVDFFKNNWKSLSVRPCEILCKYLFEKIVTPNDSRWAILSFGLTENA